MATRAWLKEILEDASSDLARDLSAHVKKIHIGGRRYRVRLTVFEQSFDIGRDEMTRKEAVFYRAMLLRALRRLCRQHHMKACIDILTHPDKS